MQIRPLTAVSYTHLSGFFKGTVGEFVSSRFDDHMGAGSLFGMKPPVVSDSEAESKFVVLKIVFADVHILSLIHI